MFDNSSMSKEELHNLSSTASKVGVPLKWLKWAALTGKVPCLKISNSRMLFNLDAVKKALADLAAKVDSDE